MDARLQRRIQRYGWDRAAADYDTLWEAPLAHARDEMIQFASLSPGQHVLDVACGTGSVSLVAARVVDPGGDVIGVDLSDKMVEQARRTAVDSQLNNASFARMDGEALEYPDASFDAVMCAFGLMYMPEPELALREMRRVLRPGGRLSLAIWGERARCGWAACFDVVDQEVASEVCPLFFRLGQRGSLERALVASGFGGLETRRIETTLCYPNADVACEAVMVGGPVAMAWSRFDSNAKERVRQRYIDALEPWRDGAGFRVPAESVVATATVPHGVRSSSPASSRSL